MIKSSFSFTRLKDVINESVGLRSVADMNAVGAIFRAQRLSIGEHTVPSTHVCRKTSYLLPFLVCGASSRSCWCANNSSMRLR